MQLHGQVAVVRLGVPTIGQKEIRVRPAHAVRRVVIVLGEHAAVIDVVILARVRRRYLLAPYVAQVGLLPLGHVEPVETQCRVIIFYRARRQPQIRRVAVCLLRRAYQALQAARPDVVLLLAVRAVKGEMGHACRVVKHRYSRRHAVFLEPHGRVAAYLGVASAVVRRGYLRGPQAVMVYHRHLIAVVVAELGVARSQRYLLDVYVYPRGVQRLLVNHVAPLLRPLRHRRAHLKFRLREAYPVPCRFPVRR